MNLEIFDCAGKFIVLPIQSTGYYHKINTSSLSNGVYFIRFKANEEMTIKRFLISK
jgi:hypothetical protein